MGTKDTTQKRLEDFEDISNVLLYDGEDVIKENELETVTAKDTYTVEQQIHEVERDVTKRWKYHSLHISLIGLENQTDPDYKMPMRVISGNDEYEQLLNQTTNNLKQNKLKGYELTMKKIVSLGFDEARAEGKAQEKFATAKHMLALGKSLQDIMLITDLPMSKIQELQSEIKSA